MLLDGQEAEDARAYVKERGLSPEDFAKKPKSFPIVMNNQFEDALADDEEVQAELKSIERDFAVTELDGLAE